MTQEKRQRIIWIVVAAIFVVVTHWYLKKFEYTVLRQQELESLGITAVLPIGANGYSATNLDKAIPRANGLNEMSRKGWELFLIDHAPNDSKVPWNDTMYIFRRSGYFPKRQAVGGLEIHYPDHPAAN